MSSSNSTSDYSKTFYSRGNNTLKVDSILYQTNRERLVQVLKKSKQLENVKNPIVLLQGGQSTLRYCTDHEPVFRQESYFHWTFGVREPDFFGAINIETGKSYLFAPNYDPDHSIWSGEMGSPEELREHYRVDQVHLVSDIEKVLNEMKTDLLLTLNGLNSDSGNYSKPATFAGIEKFKVDKNILYDVITELRVFKTKYELEVLRYVSKISSDAHKEVMKRVKPGLKEYQLEAIFKFFCAYHAGCRMSAYTCICGSGRNSAILHYGHSGKPNDKELETGDLCLLDMGAEYVCYGADITCSYPCNGKFSEQQKVIYNAVLDANLAVQKALKPGVSWPEMHLLAERVILERLRDAGLLHGDIDEMLEKRLCAIFMPHGLGHFLGIDTHDVGGYLNGHPPRSDKSGLKNLRTARVIQERMCLTIEPGCYFIRSLLDKAYQDESLSKYLIQSEIEKYFKVGGVRIEDDIYVTKDGIELLSVLPRTIKEIEDLIEIGRKEKDPYASELKW